jgi:hypothetical protein
MPTHKNRYMDATCTKVEPHNVAEAGLPALGGKGCPSIDVDASSVGVHGSSTEMDDISIGVDGPSIGIDATCTKWNLAAISGAVLHGLVYLHPVGIDFPFAERDASSKDMDVPTHPV